MPGSCPAPSVRYISQYSMTLVLPYLTSLMGHFLTDHSASSKSLSKARSRARHPAAELCMLCLQIVIHVSLVYHIQHHCSCFPCHTIIVTKYQARFSLLPLCRPATLPRASTEPKYSRKAPQASPCAIWAKNGDLALKHVVIRSLCCRAPVSGRQMSEPFSSVSSISILLNHS